MQKEKKLPERKCVGCGETKLKRDLIRIVRSPEGGISLDRTGKASGRGAYLCSDPACLAKAKKTKRLDKNLETKIPDAIYEKLEKELSEAKDDGE